MATKDILSEYGADSRTGGDSRATSGGRQEPKPLPYDPPKGPTEQMRAKPGLGGTNHGQCGTQGKH